MQHYVKQLSLVCVLSVSTLLSGTQSKDQFGAEVQTLVKKLAGVCNEVCSESSRASIRELLLDYKEAISYQIRLLKKGMSLEQVLADKKTLDFMEHCMYKGQMVYFAVTSEVAEQADSEDIMARVNAISGTFFADNMSKIGALTTDQQMQYALLAIDTALERLQ